MRVLLVTQYFYPENFKSNDLAFELLKRGHKVDALVGIPNYPEGKYYNGYGIFHKRHEIVKGVNIYRVFQTPRGKGGYRLPINYFSFVLSACLWIIFKFSWRRYDCIIGHETSPIFQAYPAILLRWIKKIPFYCWILDLWPPSIMNNPTNFISRVSRRIVEKQVRFIYKRCDKLLISSKGFEKHIVRSGGKPNQIVYFPNWSDDMELCDTDIKGIAIPEGFVIMMAGNLGISQDLESVSKLISELQDLRELKWVFVGDGSKKAWLEGYIKDNKLENCFFLGRYPYSQMPYLLSKADAMLLSLGAQSYQLDSVVPARLQSYMSSGKPIYAMIGSGGAEIIAESNCGYYVKPGHYAHLAQLIRETFLLTDKLKTLGKNGRRYYEREFTKDKCINHLCQIIES